jgi:hypothetical protein
MGHVGLPGPVGLRGDGYSANDRWWKASGLEVFVISSTLCSGFKDGLLSVSTGQCNILKT